MPNTTENNREMMQEKNQHNLTVLNSRVIVLKQQTPVEKND